MSANSGKIPTNVGQNLAKLTKIEKNRKISAFFKNKKLILENGAKECIV